MSFSLVSFNVSMRIKAGWPFWMPNNAYPKICVPGSIPKITEYMNTYPSKISDLERGKKGVEPDFLERLKKHYRLIIQYKNT